VQSGIGVGLMSVEAEKFDFFISRCGAAKGVAVEIADVLRTAGYSCFMQDDGIEVSKNFIAEIHDRLEQCRHFIAILSADYIHSPYTREEWTNFLAASDTSGGARRLIPIRIENIEPTGLFRVRVYADLVNVTDRGRRRDIILAAATGRPISDSFATKAPVFRGVPPRNPDFIGRTKLLQFIYDTLNSADRPAALAPLAIHGMGGIGKSSLAAEYAHQYLHDYAGVWWAAGGSRAVLLDSLAKFASVLDPREYGGEAQFRHAGEKDPDHEELVRAALARLTSASKPWLLVYDNVGSPAEIRGLIPSAGAHVLITTRSQNWAGWATPIPVTVFEPFEAIQLLLKITGRPSGQSAVRLAKTLGYLPLAIEQAGAYILDTGVPFNRYADRADELMARAPKDAKYPNSVSATFNLAIERALAECPAAAKLFDFLSVLAPEQIPRDLIDDTILTEDDRDEALAALHRCSLIKYEDDEPESEDSPAITVHRLVRAAMHQRLQSTGKVIDALRLAITRVAIAFPDKSYSDPKCWPRCKQLLPHALSLREEALHAKFESRELAVILDGAANYLLGRGAFGDAESLFKETVDIGRRVLGPEHVDVGRWLNNSGNLYLNSGRYEEAKEKYFESISIGVKTLGRDDPSVATRLSNLAYAFMKTGQYAEAEAYYREAIETSVKAYGRHDQRVASRLHKLAMLYHETGRQAEAETLYREAIAIGEAKLGRDDILVCDWISDLANVLRDTGRYPEAEALNREAMTNLCQVLGPEHHRIAFILSSLTELHLKMGRLDEARQEASQAVNIQKKAYGPDHRWTREAADVLNRVVLAQGQVSQTAQGAADRSVDFRHAQAG